MEVLFVPTLQLREALLRILELLAEGIGRNLRGGETRGSGTDVQVDTGKRRVGEGVL